MISDLRPYPEYKESGSRWLTNVPLHWEVRNLRTLIRPRNERNRVDLPLLSVAREKGVFVRSLTDAEENHNVIPEDLSNYKVARAGNLVINKMKAWQGSMGIAPCDGIVSPAYFVFDFGIADRAFGQALLRSKPYVAHFGQASDGVRIGQWDLTIPGMRQIPVLVPPPAEQAAIVRFLGWANGRLERAIQTKRKVIALLNEQKQVIIHRVVTRGLDPTIPLKPSGIPWLGDIPQHWALKRFKFLATVNSGQVDPRKNEYRVLVLIAPNHIQSGSGRLLKQETADEQGADSGKYLVRRGQLIYSKIRPNLRKATIAPCDCLCSADMYPIAPTTEELSTEYLLLLLLSQPFTKFAVDTSMRVAMPKVNREALANCWMWYPGRQEQVQILGFIAREGAPLDTAIARLEREIALLREYRTRLIADVVTGKLDVRGAVVHVPDEASVEALAHDDIDALDDEVELSGEEEIAA
jgi:type I restriction enzyme S subunit